MHARRREFAEGFIGKVREVECRRHHGAGAVFQQIHALGYIRWNVVEQVAHGPREAVRFGLTTHDDHVEVAQCGQQGRIYRNDGIPCLVFHHFLHEHRVVLGERIPTLDAVGHLALPNTGVEEDGLLDHGDEGVADSTEHRVEGPDHQLILPLLVQALVVVAEPLIEPRIADPQAWAHFWIDRPAPSRHIIHRHHRIGIRRFPGLIHDEGTVEDLHGRVGIHGHEDSRDVRHVAIDELRKPYRVLDRSSARSSADIQFTAGHAKRDLLVNAEKCHTRAVMHGQ